MRFGDQPPGNVEGCARSTDSRRVIAIPVVASRREHEQLDRLVVAEDSHPKDQRGKHDKRERDAAMEAAHLRVGPGVHRLDDLAPLIRVGARVLDPARVADVRSPPIADQAASVVDLLALQVLPLRALPGGLVAGDGLDTPSYAASKGAVINLTRELAVRWAPKGVRVNAIAPGWFPSEMTSETLSNEAGQRFVEDRTPLGRSGRPEELDGALLFLASRASSYVTGHTLIVDGGWTAR